MRVLTGAQLVEIVSSSLIVVQERIDESGLLMSTCSAQKDLLTLVYNFSTQFIDDVLE